MISPIRFFASTVLFIGLSACIPGTPGGPDATQSPDNSANANVDASVGVTLPDPAEIATFTGLKAVSCDQEGSLKSDRVPDKSTVVFNNKAQGDINIYWLDFNGKRVSYKQGLKAGATHNQGTFITHPWVITNDKDQCMGIYVPTDGGTTTLNVNKTVEIAGGASGSASATGTVTRQQFINLMQCYKNDIIEKTGNPLAAASVDVVIANANNLSDEQIASAGFEAQIAAARAAGCTI